MTTVQRSRSPSSPILCTTALHPRTLTDCPARLRDLTNHHDAKSDGSAFSTTVWDDRSPDICPPCTLRPEEALESMSRVALLVTYALTPHGITMDPPKGSSSRKAIRQVTFHYLPETVGPLFQPLLIT
ncbi:hypothetical protein FB451DRAFT_1393790 [Mycena latifolia]|nr:hypothetical protein FB451DRAFT_1393790 [Mycena latifolia]